MAELFHDDDDVRLWVPVASQCQQSRPVIFPTESKEHIVTMASGEHNVNRLINANASFTRQRDDARRTRQLAEERLNLVKKDSEYNVVSDRLPTVRFFISETVHTSSGQ